MTSGYVHADASRNRDDCREVILRGVIRFSLHIDRLSGLSERTIQQGLR